MSQLYPRTTAGGVKWSDKHIDCHGFTGIKSYQELKGLSDGGIGGAVKQPKLNWRDRG